MSIHYPTRQRAKRVDLLIISEQLDLVHEDLEAEASNREEDRRLMIVSGYDPDSLTKYTYLEDFEYALNRIDTTSAEEEAGIKEIKNSLRSRISDWYVDPFDYYDDFHSLDCYLLH